MQRAVEAEDRGAVGVVGHDLGHDVRHSGVDRYPRSLVGVGLVEGIALRVTDLKDRLGRVVHAHVRVDRDAAHVLEQRDRVTAQGQARAVLVGRGVRV